MCVCVCVFSSDQVDRSWWAHWAFFVLQVMLHKLKKDKNVSSVYQPVERL